MDFPHEPIPTAITIDAARQTMPAPAASTVGLTSQLLERGFLLTTRVGCLTPRDDSRFFRVAALGLALGGWLTPRDGTASVWISWPAGTGLVNPTRMRPRRLGVRSWPSLRLRAGMRTEMLSESYLIAIRCLDDSRPLS